MSTRPTTIVYGDRDTTTLYGEQGDRDVTTPRLPKITLYAHNPDAPLAESSPITAGELRAMRKVHTRILRGSLHWITNGAFALRRSWASAVPPLEQVEDATVERGMSAGLDRRSPTLYAYAPSNYYKAFSDGRVVRFLLARGVAEPWPFRVPIRVEYNPLLIRATRIDGPPMEQYYGCGPYRLWHGEQLIGAVMSERPDIG